MKGLMGKLNMGILGDSERMILTSTLNSGALRLGMQEQELSQNKIEGPQAPVKKLQEDLLRAQKEIECLRLLNNLDWSLLSTSDWCFAVDALAAGCRRSLKKEDPSAATGAIL
jgi:hypothetical protein